MHVKGRTRSSLRHANSSPRYWGVWVLTFTLALVAFGTVGPAAYGFFAQSAVNTDAIDDLVQITDPVANAEGEGDPAIVDPDAGQAVNILLIGSDTRIGENGDLGGLAGLEGMRGDTTMILHISADRERIEVVSIPRDSEVRISDCTLKDGSTVLGWTGKFNIAFANGGINGDSAEGAACVMQTIYDLTGVTFDGQYVVADFNGFKNMVDAVGGVPMCIPRDMSSTKANLDLQAGAQVLDGTEALAFARARTGFNLGDGSDLGRIERQQELLTNLARTVLGLNLFSDFGQLTEFIKATGGSLTMSPELADVTYLGQVAYSLRGFDTANLTFVTVPWSYGADDPNNVAWTYEADALWEALRNDEPIAPLFEEDPTDTTTGGTDGSGTSPDELDPTAEPWVPTVTGSWWQQATGESTDAFGRSYVEVPNPGRPTSPDEGVQVIVPEPDRESVDDILADCVLDEGY